MLTFVFRYIDFEVGEREIVADANRRIAAEKVLAQLKLSGFRLFRKAPLAPEVSTLGRSDGQ